MNHTPLPGLLDTAEPFLFSGGRTGCLLIHGFTGTPKEMRWMGEYLAQQGYTVLGIRLAGHSSDPKHILRNHWHDWLLSAVDGYHMLRACTDAVFPIGLSMGGALSLLLASHLPVTGAVALSTPISLPPDPRLPFIRPLSFFIRSVPKGAPDWRNQDAALQHADYPYYPSRSILELVHLLAEMKSRLPLVKAPLLMAQSILDQSIPQESLDTIYNRVSSTHKEILRLENSGHVITEEPERMLLFETIHQFIQKVCRGGP